MNRVDYYDLLGMPHDHQALGLEPGRIDCAGVAAVIWERAGLDTRPMSDGRELKGGTHVQFQHLMAALQISADKLGVSVKDASRIGDLVVVGDPGFPNPRAVYTLVETSPQTFLTSTLRDGCHTVPGRALARLYPTVMGVYRRKL